MEWNNKEILITGGTGSLGQKLTETLVTKYKPKGIRIFSRNEATQAAMKGRFNKHNANISYLIGDIKDFNRLKLATLGVDIIIHAAAMKRVEVCEENPIEAVQNNIIGSSNVLQAGVFNKVSKIIGISTDKVAYNINLYGATKACAEKLLIAGNIYGQGEERVPIVSCCRYGNVSASTGSVIPLFRQQKESGTITITNKHMARFWITLEEAANFVIKSIENMLGGEIFIPKMRAYNITDLAKAIAPNAKIKIISIREGEKIHETIITVEESKHMIETPNSYVLTKNVQSVPFSKQLATAYVPLLSVKELKERLKNL